SLHHLGAGDTASDTSHVPSTALFRPTANNATNGTNDPATFTGDDAGDGTEDTQTSAQGALTVSDIDDNQSSAQAASGSTALGSYSVAADGSWAYNVDNAAIQHHGASTPPNYSLPPL